MCDFYLKPTQILSKAYNDYEFFNNDSYNQKKQLDNDYEINDKTTSNKTMLYNGINSNNNLNESKQLYLNQESKQQIATDILKQELDEAENIQNDEPIKEGFKSKNNIKIEIDLKTIIIVILFIVIVYIYGLYVNTKSKLKYFKKIFKHNNYN